MCFDYKVSFPDPHFSEMWIRSKDHTINTSHFHTQIFKHTLSVPLPFHSVSTFYQTPFSIFPPFSLFVWIQKPPGGSVRSRAQRTAPPLSLDSPSSLLSSCHQLTPFYRSLPSIGQRLWFLPSSHTFNLCCSIPHPASYTHLVLQPTSYFQIYITPTPTSNVLSYILQSVLTPKSALDLAAPHTSYILCSV